jgi:hypothetical protein
MATCRKSSLPYLLLPYHLVLSAACCYISHMLRPILILVHQSLCPSKSTYILFVKPCVSTKICLSQPIAYFLLFGKVTSIWLITSSSCWGDFACALLVSYVVYLDTHHGQWPFFVVITIYSITSHLRECVISLHYLLFTVVHHLIPLLAISSSVSHHLFHLL